VVDAVGTHNRKQAALAFRKIVAKGAKLTDTKSIAGRSHLRRVGICHCRACLGRGSTLRPIDDAQDRLRSVQAGLPQKGEAIS
jgi:hypothetical protein